jgi:hypothetical protein
MEAEDAAGLRREARLCRYLGLSAEESSVQAALIDLAGEYETRASSLERAKGRALPELRHSAS